MAKQIPYIFDDVVIYQPLSPTSFSNVGRTRVRAFYKYANRNGSFITDQEAEYLIATAKTKPIVGFYNYMKEDFEGHTSPELAKGYGYIPEEPNFAWEDHLDPDGVMRTYACFDVILHVDYWDEAKQIIGKRQSMELNPETIKGEWSIIDGQEYFVYTFAEMKGFCVLGDDKEPCFEGSAFEKEKESKFEKFSLLLSDLMEKVNEAETKSEKGGEQQMIFTIPELNNENYSSLFESLNPNFNEENGFVVNEVIYSMEDGVAKTFSVTDGITHEYNFSVGEDGALSFEVIAKEEEPDYQTDFENLRTQFEELQSNFETLKNEHEVLQASFENTQSVLDEKNSAIEAFEAQIAELNSTIETANEKIASYEAQFAEIENGKKEELVASYEKLLSEEDIAPIKENVSTFSYDELETKLAVTFSRKSIEKQKADKVPLPDFTEKSQFEKLIEKYKK